jgi:electron transfer flavoprotein beta subunit
MSIVNSAPYGAEHWRPQPLTGIHDSRRTMKTLVLVKQVPDTATQVKIAGDPKSIETTGITWIVSPYDEFAVEEALRIKEKRGQGEVVVVSLGPERVKEALRSCLAMGADRAIHLLDAAWEGADALATSRALAAVIKQEAPALVLCGRQAIDDDMGAVGAQVAELMGWPCASWIMEEAVNEGATTIRIGRQVEGGLEVFDLPLPAVCSAQKGMNEPRYPTLKGIMGAKKKEIREVKAADVGIAPEPPMLSVVKLEALPPRPPGRIITGEAAAAAHELVRALREDAKAI